MATVRILLWYWVIDIETWESFQVESRWLKRQGLVPQGRELHVPHEEWQDLLLRHRQEHRE